MGYEFHIRKLSGGQRTPIPDAEWRHAVSATDGVRPLGTDSQDQDFAVIEVFYKEAPGYGLEGIWDGAIYFADGEGSVKGLKSAGVDGLDTSDPLWCASSALARRLGAIIQGDEEEIYDLDSGTPQLQRQEQGHGLRKFCGALLVLFGIFGIAQNIMNAPTGAGLYVSVGIWLACGFTGLCFLRVIKPPATIRAAGAWFTIGLGIILVAISLIGSLATIASGHLPRRLGPIFFGLAMIWAGTNWLRSPNKKIRQGWGPCP